MGPSVDIKAANGCWKAVGMQLLASIIPLEHHQGRIGASAGLTFTSKKGVPHPLQAQASRRHLSVELNSSGHDRCHGPATT